jgi:hypothetical protein
MSMDEMLLNELYGSEQVQNDEQIKQAQVELVEAVAAEAGVDLNELDDDELAKFAHYVLTDEDEEGVEYADDMNKLAEADLMGRQMAHSYYDELAQLQAGADEMDYTQVKIASAMEDVAEAWEMQKIAETPEAAAEEAKEAKEAFGARMKRYGTNAGKFTGILGTEGENYFGKRGLRLGGTAAGLAALGGGAYYMNKRRKANQEKSASVADMLA